MRSVSASSFVLLAAVMSVVAFLPSDVRGARMKLSERVRERLRRARLDLESNVELKLGLGASRDIFDDDEEGNQVDASHGPQQICCACVVSPPPTPADPPAPEACAGIKDEVIKSSKLYEFCDKPTERWLVNGQPTSIIGRGVGKLQDTDGDFASLFDWCGENCKYCRVSDSLGARSKICYFMPFSLESVDRNSCPESYDKDKLYFVCLDEKKSDVLLQLQNSEDEEKSEGETTETPPPTPSPTCCKCPTPSPTHMPTSIHCKYDSNEFLGKQHKIAKRNAIREFERKTCDATFDLGAPTGVSGMSWCGDRCLRCPWYAMKDWWLLCYYQPQDLTNCYTLLEDSYVNKCVPVKALKQTMPPTNSGAVNAMAEIITQATLGKSADVKDFFDK